MPRSGSGTYSLPSGNPVVTGTTINSTVQNNTMNDVATALTQSIAIDGQTTPTANLTLGGFKFINLGVGLNATDSANLGQIQAQTYSFLSSVAGTNTITAAATPSITGYVAGQTFRLLPFGANTGAVTISINGLPAKAITKNGLTALVTGDINLNTVYIIVYDGTQFQLINLASLVTLGINNFQGGQNFARSSIVMNATTMDLFSLSNTIDGTGAALQVTAIVNAPQAGARRTFYPLQFSIIKNNAMFAVDGGADYTSQTGDAWEFEAVTTSTYKVHITKADGTGVNTVNLTAAQTIAGIKTFTSQPVVPIQSMVRLNTANGYGSTNTGIRRWTTIVTNQGADITYADSVTLGSTFTINTSGVYSLSYTDSFNAGGNLAISRNSTLLTTIPSVLSEIAFEAATFGGSSRSCASGSMYLVAGDIIRAHGDTPTGATARQFFTITRVS